MMKFTYPLIHGRLIRRYKRFLADVILDDGTEVTAHCTNSGSMLSCLEEGAEVWLSPANDPKRKTRYTWEMILIEGDWVGINTSNPNALAFEWILSGKIQGLEGLKNVQREVKWQDSRFDLYAEDTLGLKGEEPSRGCFLEVKNVSMKVGNRALFPDAITERGRKHLRTLIRVKKAGLRAVMIYVVQRSDVNIFSPAREIDPAYGQALDEAVRQGVEIFVVQAKVTPGGIDFHRLLPVEL